MFKSVFVEFNFKVFTDPIDCVPDRYIHIYYRYAEPILNVSYGSPCKIAWSHAEFYPDVNFKSSLVFIFWAHFAFNSDQKERQQIIERPYIEVTYAPKCFLAQLQGLPLPIFTLRFLHTFQSARRCNHRTNCYNCLSSPSNGNPKCQLPLFM